MLAELQRRYFAKSRDQLGPEQIRDYQVHLFRDRKLSPGTVEGRGACGICGVGMVAPVLVDAASSFCSG
jgi:hypothetical protein